MALSKPIASKLKERSRTFHEEWEMQYCFTESKALKPICLICSTTIAVAKKYNLERHFKQNHSSINKNYPEGSSLRAEFIKKKKKEIFGQQNLFVKKFDELESMVKTSYEISLLLAKNKKPFSDGEIIKEALSIFSNNCNDKNIKTKADGISLSRNTVTRRVEEMSNDISNQITQTVTKYLLELSQLETTSTGRDIFMKIKECVDRKGIAWEKINSVCTDGAPAMTGKINGCVALLKQFLGRELFSYHCIIHQEALCAKDMKFNDVIDPVVRCINYIRAKALHRRQFRVLFEEEINEFGELHLYCAVRWLSKGEMLKHFFLLRREVLQFLVEKQAMPDERDLLESESWLCDLAFLIDITQHLNILNWKLQGKDCSLPIMFNLVYGFKAKLSLFLTNLTRNNIDHFPTLVDIRGKLENTSPDISKYQTQIQLLLQSFENRFQDFEKDKNNILFFMNRFSITFSEIQKYSCNIQLEITEIQNHVSLKQIFTEIVSSQPQLQSSENVLKFWKLVPKEDFPATCDLALQISSRFGSTYICEKAFSTLTYVKNKYRSSLTAPHISDLMLLSTSDLSPDIEKLLANKSLHRSH
ncbi:general transcription factor II-I repeat domain-containing protein 2B-like [Sipha flava]|uniref:General transcription factor II-I repeat domain-containing protein 2B-like n=1 Tax=Sipha flava TaxID=143950 RepID=A0A8B8GPM2_9HEMI|nr:general transcription factor II-I repeat domain-containing protein 2B-like [Sipha flava]